MRTDINESLIHVCPLCATDFSGAACHAACPLSRGCAMVRCPFCSYEFPAKSSLVRAVEALLDWRSSRKGERRS